MTMTLKLEYRDWPHGYYAESAEIPADEIVTGAKIQIPPGGPASGVWIVESVASVATSGESNVSFVLRSETGDTGTSATFTRDTPILRLGRYARQVNPCEMKQTWIADVTQVTVLGRVMPDALATIADLFPGSGGIEMWTWCGDEDQPQDGLLGSVVMRTVIMARTGQDTRWLCVERAWLLGPTGGTIERIAP